MQQAYVGPITDCASDHKSPRADNVYRHGRDISLVSRLGHRLECSTFTFCPR